MCLAIVATLLTLVVPRYFERVRQAEESVLRQNLATTRDAIDKFFADRGRYPASLAELVDARYLRALPLDPILKRADAWVIVAPPAPHEGAVYDLKSGAEGTALDGRPLAQL